MQREDGGGQAFTMLMASSLTLEQAISNSMGFYVVLDAAEDLNDDGVPDGLAAQLGLNPLNDLSQTDSDGDGLTDQQEIVFGSDLLKSDTDGDGLSDYWELTYDSNPRNPLGGPGMFPRSYTVSATNSVVSQGITYTTYRNFHYQSFLGAWETNRTVLSVPTNDVTGYVTVSSWPWEKGDLGFGTNLGWATLVGGGTTPMEASTNIQPPLIMGNIWMFGNLEDGTYQGQFAMVTHGTNSAMKRAYEIQLEAWTGTNLATATPITDFTGFSIMGQAATSDGKIFFLAPEDTLTNANVVTPVQYAQLFLRATTTLVPIDIQEVISDQIAGNEANKLPTAYYEGEQNNPMLMATRSGTTAHIAVRVSYTNALRTNVVVGVRKVAASTILASAPAQQAPTRTMLQFTAENGAKTYEVVAGYDYNANGILDSVEVTTVFSKTPKTSKSGSPASVRLDLLDKIIIVTADDFSSAQSFLEFGDWAIGTGYAGDLANMFARGATNIATATVTTGITVSSTTPGLSHKVGAKWNGSNEDTTHRFTFPDGGAASNDFEASQALLAIIDKVIKTNIDTLITAGGSSFTTSGPMAFAIPVNLLVTEKPVLLPNAFNKLGNAFGQVTVNGSLLVLYATTSPTTIAVSQVNVTGSFDDLYDFFYNPRSPDNSLPRRAAVVQAGHASLSTTVKPGGKIFFTCLEYSTGWRAHNKSYSK
jgi:hypothetical protein